MTNPAANAVSNEKRIAEVDENIQRIFDVRKRLGKGAYGIVWKAVDRRTHETIALKKIFDAFRDETDAQRTYREIVFLRAFRSHPNIIRILDIYKASNHLDFYLVFEYMESDLHNVIKKGDVLKDVHKRFVMFQLLNAIRYMHSGNVIHRDLKPSNILIDSKCRLKVADFGLARSLAFKRPKYDGEDVTNELESEPVLTDYVATRWYRAPEILVASKTYTKGIDMWSLGCILGEMLRQKPLFQGTSTVNQIEKIITALPEVTPRDIHAIGASFGSVLLSKKVPDKRNTLDEMLRTSTPDAVNLVKALLVFDPHARLTAKEALQHEYVQRFRTSSIDLETIEDIKPALPDDVRVSVSEYRNKLYEMIAESNANRIYRDPYAKLRSKQRDQCDHVNRPNASIQCDNSHMVKPTGLMPATDTKQPKPQQQLQQEKQQLQQQQHQLEHRQNKDEHLPSTNNDYKQSKEKATLANRRKSRSMSVDTKNLCNTYTARLNNNSNNSNNNKVTTDSKTCVEKQPQADLHFYSQSNKPFETVSPLENLPSHVNATKSDVNEFSSRTKTERRNPILHQMTASTICPMDRNWLHYQTSNSRLSGNESPPLLKRDLTMHESLQKEKLTLEQQPRYKQYKDTAVFKKEFAAVAATRSDINRWKSPLGGVSISNGDEIDVRNNGSAYSMESNVKSHADNNKVAASQLKKSKELSQTRGRERELMQALEYSKKNTNRKPQSRTNQTEVQPERKHTRKYDKNHKCDCKAKLAANIRDLCFEICSGSELCSPMTNRQLNQHQNYGPEPIKLTHSSNEYLPQGCKETNMSGNVVNEEAPHHSSTKEHLQQQKHKCREQGGYQRNQQEEPPDRTRAKRYQRHEHIKKNDMQINRRLIQDDERTLLQDPNPRLKRTDKGEGDRRHHCRLHRQHDRDEQRSRPKLLKKQKEEELRRLRQMRLEEEKRRLRLQWIKDGNAELEAKIKNNAKNMQCQKDQKQEELENWHRKLLVEQEEIERQTMQSSRKMQSKKLDVIGDTKDKHTLHVAMVNRQPDDNRYPKEGDAIKTKMRPFVKSGRQNKCETVYVNDAFVGLSETSSSTTGASPICYNSRITFLESEMEKCKRELVDYVEDNRLYLSERSVRYHIEQLKRNNANKTPIPAPEVISTVDTTRKKNKASLPSSLRRLQEAQKLIIQKPTLGTLTSPVNLSGTTNVSPDDSGIYSITVNTDNDDCMDNGAGGDGGAGSSIVENSKARKKYIPLFEKLTNAESVRYKRFQQQQEEFHQRTMFACSINEIYPQDPILIASRPSGYLDSTVKRRNRTNVVSLTDYDTVCCSDEHQQDSVQHRGKVRQHYRHQNQQQHKHHQLHNHACDVEKQHQSNTQSMESSKYKRDERDITTLVVDEERQMKNVNECRADHRNRNQANVTQQQSISLLQRHHYHHRYDMEQRLPNTIQSTETLKTHQDKYNHSYQYKQPQHRKRNKSPPRSPLAIKPNETKEPIKHLTTNQQCHRS